MSLAPMSELTLTAQLMRLLRDPETKESYCSDRDAQHAVIRLASWVIYNTADDDQQRQANLAFFVRNLSWLVENYDALMQEPV